MAIQPLKLFVTLKQIHYSGNNIGSDLSFAFETNGEMDFLQQKNQVWTKSSDGYSFVAKTGIRG